jgi:DNA-binding transcriptional LysR family regulator
MIDVEAAELAAGLAPRLGLLREVAATSNLTRAADQLGVPQPTATRWLAGLSTRLGVPVTARAGRGITLTRAGRHLADAATRALAELETGCQQALEEADPERGQVALGFLHTMGGVRVPELLRAFRAAHPAVRFSLSQGGHQELLRQVRDGAIDLALTAPVPVDSPDLAGLPLARQPVVVTVPSGHRLARRRRVTLTELANEDFVGLKRGFGLRQITDQLFAEAGFTPKLAFEGEEADTLRGLIAAGLGVALLPSSEPAPPPGVVELMLSPPVYRTIGVVWVSERPLPPAARTFREFAARQRNGAVPRT